MSKDKYIPEGHWYGHIDKDALSELNDIELQTITEVMKNGFRNRKQGIARLHSEERKGTDYEYKIRLLGSNGKGDMRIYGYVEKVKMNDKIYQLIHFNHIEYKSHKAHHLPKFGSSIGFVA